MVGGALGEDKSANDDSEMFVLDRVLSVSLFHAYSLPKKPGGKAGVVQHSDWRAF